MTPHRDHHTQRRESRGPSSDLISDIFYMTGVDAKMDDLLERMEEMRELISRSLSIRKTTRRELLSAILTASQNERLRS
ncbi:hypothetical protein PFISCL1PPCAC_23143 [Pristionchus fissidentatus]|uniref:Uncharacterized protein n=1 Tax=Pristionchus fissidentatus TaxID=1538716 RepID=A0AAV5WHU3_9BILA|nr:hypothetical protein PFISCL1PPCAC_23143 [Pristionchus fissidentatus]